MPATPSPISQYVIKVHSRCDLACDHCYIYEHADQSWRNRPRAIAPAIVTAAARRIAEHAAAHRLPQVHVVLHGGEPLLLGPQRLRAVLSELTATIAPVAALRLGMQTNGVRLTEEFCDLLLEYGVRVGVSLDGSAEDNDRHRLFAGGVTSHPQVLEALRLLRRPGYRAVYGGLLCTVDVRNDPVRVYEALMEQEPPRIDFLLPHATWDAPPPRPDGVRTPYADWLQRVHDRWRHDGMPVSIRMFESLEALANGGRSDSEAFGLDPVDLAVIETDGAWEQVDSLKVAFDGATATDLSVFAHSVDDVARHPDIAGRLQGVENLCEQCRRCSVVRQCGGGLYAHRYSTGRGFGNPSVYCPDLLRLITSLHKGAESRVMPQPITPEMLADLATGRGSASTIGALAAAQRDLVLSLLKALGRRIARADAIARSGWLALNALYGYADEVLSHPFVRTWAVRCLREMRSGFTGGAAYLANISAAMAIRSGADLTIAVASPGGTVGLPGLGRLVRADLDGVTELSISDGGLAVRDRGGRTHVVRPSEAVGGWQPIRSVALSGTRVALEDTEIYRDCYGAPVADRLSAEDASAWRKSLEGAWASIERDAPAYRPTVAGALRSVVPLRPAESGERSATCREAYAAVAMTPTADPDGLAALIVHELQHVKLGAVLDFCTLVEPDFSGRVRVPWRDDLRPVEGALQGAYAYLALADLHWSRRIRLPESADRYRTLRHWTLGGIAAVRASGGLTPAGARFAEMMAQTVYGWGTAAR